LELDRKYLGSLLNDIHVERVKRLNTITLHYALSAFQDTMTEIVQKAWEIVNDPMAERSDALRRCARSARPTMMCLQAL
jgi:hypothetical protein